MRVLRIGLHVEGNSDWEFLEPLLNRLIAACVPEGTGISPERLGRAERAAITVASTICRAHRSRAIDMVCVHRDAESATRADSVRVLVCDSCAEAEAMCGFPAARCVPLVPMRCIEAWALADTNALCNVFGVRALPPEWSERLRSPETTREPKAALRDLQAEIRGRRGFLQPLGTIAEVADFATLRAKCPSFAAAADAISAACAVALATPLTRPSSAPR